jgi:hypothetical protein
LGAYIFFIFKYKKNIIIIYFFFQELLIIYYNIIMNIKREYLIFGFLMVIFLINTVKNRCKENADNQSFGGNKNIKKNKNQSSGENQSSEYEFSGGNINDSSNPQENNCQDNCQNEKDINSNNCPSCINKCPEVLQNSEKLIFEISDLLKECKKEEKSAENIMKQNIKTIQNCIKQDLKYKQISKNYYKAIRILSENIDICEKNKKIINSDCINNKNLVDVIDEIY